MIFSNFNQILITVNSWIIYSSILMSFTSIIIFYNHNVKKFEKEYRNISNKEYKWLIWPAIFTNEIYSIIFGKPGKTIRSLLTWRSIFVTFLFSLIANSLCIFFLLTYTPNEFPPFELELINIIIISYLVFIIFNLIGDLISISVTRYVISIIATQKVNYLRYLRFEFFGILLGYVITFLPSLLIFLYCWITGDELNKWIRMGIGNAIIPFFLMIFATSNFAFPFTVFAFFAVFSITIPTAIYLFMMIFCYFCYRFYAVFNSSQNLQSIKALHLTSKIILFISSFSLAIIYILQNG